MTASPHPSAPAAHTVHFGPARFQWLTPRMVRMEWVASGDFDDRATLAVCNRNMPRVAFRKTVRGKRLTLRSSGVTVRFRDDGRPFSGENLSVSFRCNGRSARWTPASRAGGNLGATLRTLDRVRGDQAQQKVVENGHTVFRGWKRVNLGEGFLSRDGWARVDESRAPRLDPRTGWACPPPTDGRIDWTLFFYGLDHAAALRDAAEVFGRQPIPPRFAFGIWWSRYTPYTDREIEALADGFDRRDLPLDVMVLDMDWHLPGWTGYTWDRRYFPDPDRLLRDLHARGLRVTLNLHPHDGICRHEEAFEAMARAMGLDPKSADRVPFDCADPRFMKAYFQLLHHPEERRGVDFWWMDWQQGETTRIPGLDPLPWLNHLHWRDMEARSKRTGKRPLIFSRYGGIGSGRMCLGFSGDAFSEWESLQFQPHFTATAANVLYGYWSHDIGGHMPGDIEPELYVRWVQFGVYSPVLRTHVTRNAKAERRTWAYPEPHASVMAEAFRLRMRLTPYLYTACRRAWDTGLSLCRPMYHDWPREPEAYTHPGQYRFGAAMIVAPVTKPRDPLDETVEVETWLPRGAWYDSARGVTERGGRTILRRYALDEIPAFVSAGSVIPMQPDCLRQPEGGYPELCLSVYPGADGAGELYEDDGTSVGYQRGECSVQRFVHRWSPGRQTLRITPAKGAFRGMREARPVTAFFHGVPPPRRVRLGRTALAGPTDATPGWSYDGQTATVRVRLGRRSSRRGMVLTLEKPAAQARLAEGWKVRAARLDRVMDLLKDVFRGREPKERIVPDLAQAGRRVSLEPSRFAAEARRLSREIGSLLAVLSGMSGGFDPARTDPLSETCRKARAILQTLSGGSGKR